MKTTTKKTTKKATKSAKPHSEAVRPLKLYSVDEILAMPLEEPEYDDPEVLEVTVIGLAINPRYVYAGLDGNRIAVEVPARLSPRMLKKTIKVTKKLDSDTYELYHGN